MSVVQVCVVGGRVVVVVDSRGRGGCVRRCSSMVVVMVCRLCAQHLRKLLPARRHPSVFLVPT